MKTLVIADNDSVVEKIKNSLEKANIDAIYYRWLLKALDNIEEISPDLVIISAAEYPRHWKTLVQYCKSGILKKCPEFILYRNDDISEEELNKEKALGIKGVFTNFVSNHLEELLKEERTSKAQEEVSVKEEIKLSQNTKADSNLVDCPIPSVSDILNCKADSINIPSVDNLLMFEDIQKELKEDKTQDITVENEVEELVTEEKNKSENFVSTSLPNVDNILAESSVIPRVDMLIPDFTPSVESLEETSIPTVDYVFENTAAGKRKHSLLAKIQELYG